MEAFDILRANARGKRDIKILAARELCNKELRRIAQLERDLRKAMPRTKRVGQRPFWMIVLDVLRAGDPMTIPELVAKLRHSYPRRKIVSQSIRPCVIGLRARGLAKQLRHSGSRIAWVASDYAGPSKRYDLWTFADVARDILNECGPMTDLYLLTEMRRREYRDELRPKYQLWAMRKSLSETPSVFRRDDKGRWRAK